QPLREPLRLLLPSEVERPARHPACHGLPVGVGFAVSDEKKSCHELPSDSFLTGPRAAPENAPPECGGAQPRLMPAAASPEDRAKPAKYRRRWRKSEPPVQFRIMSRAPPTNR